MRRISDTIARLAAGRTSLERGRVAPVTDGLQEMRLPGSNPGGLRARLHVPQRLPARPALVVVLHGCTQTAASYDAGAGWSRLADEQGFVVLFPEQQRANNPNLCFNWFSPQDTARDAGEALSIRQMIANVVRDRAIDPARVFVTGLSAGGAMASVMLATYPEVFAGGAIIAGLPYGSASGVSQALDRMRGHGMPDAAALGALVRRASDHRGPWPAISVWHGMADPTVHPDNAGAIVAQWQAVHGVDRAAAAADVVDGVPRRQWRDVHGRIVIEDYRIAGMGHGTPIDTATDGLAGAHMLAAGISSTRRTAGFWGLMDAGKAGSDACVARVAGKGAPLDGAEAEASSSGVPSKGGTPGTAPAEGVARIIDDALRAAGLLR